MFRHVVAEIFEPFPPDGHMVWTPETPTSSLLIASVSSSRGHPVSSLHWLRLRREGRGRHLHLRVCLHFGHSLMPHAHRQGGEVQGEPHGFSVRRMLGLACISTLHSAPHHHHHIASITSHHITLQQIHVTAQLFDSSDFSRQAHRPHCLGAGA